MEKNRPNHSQGISPVFNSLRVALIYDRINKFGGAERLLLFLHQIFPHAPIYTLVHNPQKASWAKDIKIVPSFLQKIPLLSTKHEWLAPIAPLAFETHDLSQYDILISVTSSDAKAIITRPHQLHVCYCLTPTRYFWSGEDNYSSDTKIKILPKFIKNYFKWVDLAISKRPDEYISISKEVKKRVQKYYKRDSPIIYPPIDKKFYTKTNLTNRTGSFYLVVSRLVPYKRTDLVIEAFNRLGLPLVIVGTGSEFRKLKNMAGKNIIFAGLVNDEQLLDYYRKAKAVIFPQEEDFGLVPVEAQACGTPVIAYGKGGALETVIHGETGIHFSYQTVDCLLSAIHEFNQIKFNPTACVKNALNYHPDTFLSSFPSLIQQFWKKHNQN